MHTTNKNMYTNKTQQITLDGVLHSINEAGTTMPTDSWYGSEKIVDLWLEKALKKIM